MKKRVISSLLIAVMAVGMLAGCGSTSSSEPEESSTEEESTEEESTEADSNKIIIACSDAAEPYSYVADGEHQGFEVDMWAEISERTGYEVEMQTMGFSSIFGSLDSGKADVAGNFFGKNEERLEKYDASISYAADGVSAAVMADNTEIKTVEDLNGKTVGVGEGTQGQAVAEELADEYGYTISVFGDGTSGTQDLSLGRTDAWIESDITIAIDSAKAGIDVIRLEPRLVESEVGYFFRKNDEDAAKKLEAVNKALQEMLEDGTVKEISEKWFHMDVTEGL